jgi:hypothetical protein
VNLFWQVVTLNIDDPIAVNPARQSGAALHSIKEIELRERLLCGATPCLARDAPAKALIMELAAMRRSKKIVARGGAESLDVKREVFQPTTLSGMAGKHATL